MQKSDSITEISKALAKFQAEVENPPNTADNPFFKSKYAPLPDILNDVRPLLASHGLSVIQMPGGDGESITVTTTLLHASGEWIESEPLTLPSTPDNKGKYTAQGAGSAITYGRRYALAAMLGISGEDDDGAVVSGTTGKPEKAPAKKPAKSGTDLEQLRRKFFAIARGKGLDDEEIKFALVEAVGVDSTKELDKAQLTEAIEHIATVEVAS